VDLGRLAITLPLPFLSPRACVDLADRAPGLTVLERMVNGQPGLITQQDGVTAAVLAFDVARDRIKHIWAVLNPEKLRPWTTA